MPKRRTNRHKLLEKRKKVTKFNPLLLVMVALSIFILFFFFKLQTIEKFIYLNKTEVGDAEIIIVNPKSDEVIKYLIPSDTQFEASGGYGNYKLSSLWILSEKDDNDGKLVSNTVAKNYSLPVYYWKDGKESNLSIYQKTLITLNVMSESNYESEITDKKISDSILINFADSRFLDNDLKIEIEDLTGTQSVIDKVSRIIEVLGGKVSNNSKGYDAELDCEIAGKDQEIVNVVNSIFNCGTNVDVSLNVDLKISLGAKFTSRF